MLSTAFILMRENHGTTAPLYAQMTIHMGQKNKTFVPSTVMYYFIVNLHHV
jgi:hypothetical protein